MAKNRIIYQSEAVYAGPAAPQGTYVSEIAGGSNPLNLQRVQSVNYGFDVTRTDVNQFGELAAIDRVILESPTVSLDFSYYVANFANEDVLGFNINAHNTAYGSLTSAITNFLDRSKDERNYYVKVVRDGIDAIGALDADRTGTTYSDTIGIGNAFVTSYSTEASVGDFPTASVTVEALNIKFDAGTTGNLTPEVNPANGTAQSTLYYGLPATAQHATSTTAVKDVSTVRPGDITLDIGLTSEGLAGSTHEKLGADISDLKVQNYSLSFDLAREPLNKLGSKFAFARVITFPVTVTLSVDALLGELADGNLAEVLVDDFAYDTTINMSSGNSKIFMAYVLKNAKLDSHAYSSTIGDNKSVTMNFSAQIGSKAQTTKGLMMSGVK